LKNNKKPLGVPKIHNWFNKNIMDFTHELSELSKQFDKELIIGCFCNDRVSKFNPGYDEDNEFWWCQVHEFQGVIYTGGKIHRVREINDETGDFIYE